MAEVTYGLNWKLTEYSDSKLKFEVDDFMLLMDIIEISGDRINVQLDLFDSEFSATEPVFRGEMSTPNLPIVYSVPDALGFSSIVMDDVDRETCQNLTSDLNQDQINWLFSDRPSWLRLLLIDIEEGMDEETTSGFMPATLSLEVRPYREQYDGEALIILGQFYFIPQSEVEFVKLISDIEEDTGNSLADVEINELRSLFTHNWE